MTDVPNIFPDIGGHDRATARVSLLIPTARAVALCEPPSSLSIPASTEALGTWEVVELPSDLPRLRTLRVPREGLLEEPAQLEHEPSHRARAGGLTSGGMCSGDL